MTAGRKRAGSRISFQPITREAPGVPGRVRSRATDEQLDALDAHLAVVEAQKRKQRSRQPRKRPEAVVAKQSKKPVKQRKPANSPSKVAVGQPTPGLGPQRCQCPVVSNRHRVRSGPLSGLLIDAVGTCPDDPRWTIVRTDDGSFHVLLTANLSQPLPSWLPDELETAD